MSELTDTSIVNLLIETMIDKLTNDLITSVDDDAKVGLIKEGRLLDDPSTLVKNLMLRTGGEDWPHVLNTSNPGIKYPTYEMGGHATFYWYRYFMEFQLFFDDEPDEAYAERKANTILSRTKFSLVELNQPGMLPGPDSYHESANLLQVPKFHIKSFAGDGTYYWRGRMYIEVSAEQELDF